jgi:RNA polymerase sigma-70 factor (ECF subfamily)
MKLSMPMDDVRASGDTLASENELIERALRGEREAYGELVERYSAVVTKTLYYLVGDRDEADDLAQEVFIRAYRGLRTFKGTASFRTWLYRIVHNVGASHFAYRKAKKRNARLTSIDALEQGDVAAASTCEPADRLVSGELKDAIEEAIQALPADMRAFVILRDIEERPYEEISEIVGAPLGTVKSRIHRARLLLRDRLKRYL